MADETRVSAMIVELPRAVQVGDHGIDITGHKRAVFRFLGDHFSFHKLMLALPVTRRTFGPFFEVSVNRARGRFGLPKTGVIDRVLYAKLVSVGAYDAYAYALLNEYAAQHPAPPAMCYPHPSTANTAVCQGLHPTAGLSGNWAIDFCCAGGTSVVAVEAATVRKLSGRPPSWGADQIVGIFGWSIHYETKAGYRYFGTHFGEIEDGLAVGSPLRCGERIGKVGSWPGDPGRSHLHLGVTSPFGVADAKKRILKVSTARRVYG